MTLTNGSQSLRYHIATVALPAALCWLSMKYNAANYERIALVVPKGKKDKIKAVAQSQGESLNGFVNKAIDNELKRCDEQQDGK